MRPMLWSGWSVCAPSGAAFAAITKPFLRKWLSAFRLSGLSGSTLKTRLSWWAIWMWKHFRFFGPLTPQAHTLSRLLESLENASLQAVPLAPVTKHLLHGLQSAPQHWIKA